jgi:hypothetical protein
MASEIKVDTIVNAGGDNDSGIDLSTNDAIKFDIAGSEKARVDSNGHILVGKTSTGIGTVGAELKSSGELLATVSGDACAFLNRTSSDGAIVDIRKDGTSLGVISIQNTDNLRIAGKASDHAGLEFGTSNVFPVKNDSESDDAVDLGVSNLRFDDIYATNGTIQTSDQNEKNTITDSDLGLDFVNRLAPKSYIFNGKTRTHYGLIAQDVETVLSDISKETSEFAGFIKDDISEEQDGSQYRYGLRYTEFVGILIKALQEADDKIDTLTARVTALESK